MMMMTNEIATNLVKADQEFLNSRNGETSDTVVVKFFNPCGAATWWIVSGTPLDEDGEPCFAKDAKDWHLFGFADIGDVQCAELGYVLLSQLEEIELPFGLTIERDLHYTGETLTEVQAKYRRLAAGVPA